MFLDFLSFHRSRFDHSFVMVGVQAGDQPQPVASGEGSTGSVDFAPDFAAPPRSTFGSRAVPGAGPGAVGGGKKPKSVANPFG